MIHKESWYQEMSRHSASEADIHALVERSKRGDVAAFEDLYHVAQRRDILWQTLDIPWDVVKESFVADISPPYKNKLRVSIRDGQMSDYGAIRRPESLEGFVTLARGLTAHHGTPEKHNFPFPSLTWKYSVERGNVRKGEHIIYGKGKNRDVWIEALQKWMRE